MHSNTRPAAVTSGANMMGLFQGFLKTHALTQTLRLRRTETATCTNMRRTREPSLQPSRSRFVAGMLWTRPTSCPTSTQTRLSTEPKKATECVGG